LGDRKHQICVLDGTGRTVRRDSVNNTTTAVRMYFSKYADALVAMETGTHSPWISRLLQSLGCRVRLHHLWQASVDYEPPHAAGVPVAE